MRRDIGGNKKAMEISRLEDLFTIIGEESLDQRHTTTYYFRGESEFGRPLIPKLLRTATLQGQHGIPRVIKGESTINEIQRRMLQRLKRYAVHLYLQHNRPWQGEHPSDWEWLCVAQHHGLPTLLSDWTINPLVALYFSASTIKDKKDGAFYVMELQDKDIRDRENLSIRIGQTVNVHTLEEATKPLTVVPLVFTRRIEAQGSRFIYAGHAGRLDPNKTFHDRALDKISEKKPIFPCKKHIFPWKSIKKYRVLGDAKVDILRQLGNAQIHHGTLFPDLDGYSAYLASGGD